jgi:two-component system KDP operon response regulator KdpE
MPHSLLLVEDDAEFRAQVRIALSSDHQSIIEAGTIADAIEACRTAPPAVIVLDLGLPDADGVDALRRLRAVSAAPVIVLSGRTAERDKVELLDAGADDFLTKPCGAAELAARVRNQLRRTLTNGEGRSSAVVRAGEITIDLARARVTKGAVEERLTPTEVALLRAFVAHAGRTLTHRELWELVWGREYGDPQLHLRVHVTHLRRKIEHDSTRPALIITEPGVGYRFELP